MLSCLHSLFHTVCLKITEGETGEEIWPPVNYLFFISTSLIYRENQQVRQGIVRDQKLRKGKKKIWKVCLGQEMSGAGDV